MTPLHSIPAAIRELYEAHLTRVAEAVVSGNLEPVFLSLDQLLEFRALALRFEDPQDPAELQRLRGAIAEVNAIRDALARRVEAAVATMKGNADDPKERLDTARAWLSGLASGQAGPVG